jgi:hypothetical protein
MAYQMRSPGTLQLETGVRETMRREATMDDAVFRPNLRARERIMPPGRQVRGQGIAVASAHNIRKRKRRDKESD